MRRVLMTMVVALSLVACAGPGGGKDGSGGVKPYPLDTCLVTGSKLGSMGDPYVKTYGDQEIKFCCEPCVDEFEEDKERFLKMLSE